MNLPLSNFGPPQTRILEIGTTTCTTLHYLPVWLCTQVEKVFGIYLPKVVNWSCRSGDVEIRSEDSRWWMWHVCLSSVRLCPEQLPFLPARLPSSQQGSSGLLTAPRAPCSPLCITRVLLSHTDISYWAWLLGAQPAAPNSVQFAQLE